MNKLPTIDCIHFGPCGGCTLQTPYSPPIWEEVKNFFIQQGVDPGEMITDAIIGWRTKAKLAVRGKAAPAIGLFRAGSHDVLPIPHCQIHHPSINRAVAIIEDAVCQEHVSLYDEKSGKGVLRYIQCFAELIQGKIQLVLIVQARDQSIDRLCYLLQKNDLFHSIWLNIQPHATNTILGESWIHVWGPAFLEQKLAGHSFLFHPGAFSQAHWSLFEKLALDVVNMVPEKAKLLEIYAGIGAMGILAAPKCTSVALIENNPFAEKSFKALNIETIPYYLNDAREATKLIPNADCFILDPPRKGVDALLLNTLQWAAGTIIYVSCDFNSFARDAEELIDAGWVLKEAKGYLLFPGTNHIETVAKFEKQVSNNVLN